MLRDYSVWTNPFRKDRVTMVDMIPPSWKPYIRTREEAAALAYFGGEPDQEALAQFAAGVAAMGTRE
jgi:hypothetical protein